MKRFRKAFTLIELLVVIAIIALLLAILTPGLQKAKGIAQQIICLSNTKTGALSSMSYTIDNDNRFMTHRYRGVPIADQTDWTTHLVPYLGEQKYKTTFELALGSAQARLDYYEVWWDMLCPLYPPTLSWNGKPVIYGINMGGEGLGSVPGYTVEARYKLGYGIWEFSSGETRKTTQTTSRGLMFGEILDADYIWATFANIEGTWGLGGIAQVSLENRHPHGNAGAFCDGHAEMFNEEQQRNPETFYWKVTRK